jgi:hypothetical protein
VVNLLCVCGFLALAGGGGPKLVPVSGTVTLDGKPFSGCIVTFVPDTAKGNKGNLAPQGRLNAQGQFTLVTAAVIASDGGPGAPLGWYKVTLRPGLGDKDDLKVDPKYLDSVQTPISFEVVENPPPGHYDFKVTK